MLTSEDGKLATHCASSDCRSLFLDISWNKRRRWCEMSSCSNRAKARRHYRRKKLIAS
ncbi:MAG: CGNR zinc finger domain-containing protein [Chloroflexi bacterium]|nr:CGNR zinc finger domain-containing protein [Chloroflexota bacterium]